MGEWRGVSSCSNGVPNPGNLMPDDLRWSWYNNNSNKVHNKCNTLKSYWNHLLPPWKSVLPWNWSLVPKSLGTAALGHWLSPTGCGGGDCCIWVSQRGPYRAGAVLLTFRITALVVALPHTSPTAILGSSAHAGALSWSIQSSGPGLGALVQRVRSKASEHNPLQANETRPSTK